MQRLQRHSLIAALVLAGVALRTFAASRGWLYWDDLILQSKARATGMPDVLIHSQDGHFMPGAWVIEWLLATLAPLNFPAVLVVLAVLQLAAAGAVTWCCLVLCPRAWRGIPLAALPVALYLLAPLTLSVTTWLAAGINALPMHAAIAMVTGHAVRYHHEGRRRDLVATVAWLVAGLLFNERVLFVGPLVIAMLACWGYRHRLTRLAAALAVPTVAWAVLYFVLIDPTAGAVDRISLAGLIVRGYIYGLLPTAAGGPWIWERWQPSPPFTAAPTAIIVLGALVVGLTIVWSRRHVVAWLPVVVYPLAPIAALWWARSSEVTALEIVQTLRHISEVSVIVALTLAVLIQWLRIGPVVVSVAAAIAASSLVSTVTYARAWSEQPAREYFSNLDGPVLDQEVPLEVLLPVTSPHNRLSMLVPSLVEDSTTQPSLIDASGNRQPATLSPQRVTVDGPEPDCGTRITGPSSLPLESPVFKWDWTILVNYFAESETTVNLALDGESVPVALQAGLNQVWVRVNGGGGEIRIEPTKPGNICVGRSEVGQLVPATP